MKTLINISALFLAGIVFWHLVNGWRTDPLLYFAFGALILFAIVYQIAIRVNTRKFKKTKKFPFSRGLRAFMALGILFVLIIWLAGYISLERKLLIDILILGGGLLYWFVFETGYIFEDRK